MPDIAHTLAWAQTQGLERLDAQLLLLHALDTPTSEASARRTWLLAHGEEQVPAPAQFCFADMVRRRAGGEPLAYITGHKEFFGLDLQVDARVLVPRPDTETLVTWALEVLAGPIAEQFRPPIAALDLGTGSGAIALALKHCRPDLRVDAVDASADALQVAQANALRLRLNVQFLQGSWLDQVMRRYHCIVSNPPYIAIGDPHLPALSHEPVQALVSGADGLDDIRLIVAQAGTRLYPGGWLLLEHGFDQALPVRALFATAGYDNITSRRDLGGNTRCTGGQMRASMLGIHASGSPRTGASAPIVK